MKDLKILSDWISHLNTKPLVVYSNCNIILAELKDHYKRIQLIGRGYSGAQLVTAIQMINQASEDPMNIHGVILRKGDEVGTCLSTRFTYDPIVVIDDDAFTGRTFKAISESLGWHRVSKPLVADVEVVIAIANPHAKESDVHMHILSSFPACKLWIR